MQTQDKGVEILNGCGVLHSPRHVANMMHETRSYSNKSMMVSESFSSYSSSSTTCYSVSSSHSSSTMLNGNESRLITPTKVVATGGPEHQVDATSPSSFIMQRVERLYGPAALAQGFYTRRTTTATSSRKFTDHNNKEVTNSHVSIEKTEDSLPVLKLLRPEFRAQLTVANRKCRNFSTSLDRPSNEERMNSLDKLDQDVIDATALPKEVISPEKEIKDGHYFLKALDNEVKQLEELASTVEEELKTCTSEEGCGILRAVAGKARLLVAQKLNQFRGLCHNNIKQTSSEDFPTTNEDLAGFWDMVMIQVREVLNQFENIKELRCNNWQTPKEKETKTTNGCSKNNNNNNIGGIRKGSQKRPTSAENKMSASNSARDEARKKLLEEKRKAMRQNKQQANNDTLFIV